MDSDRLTRLNKLLEKEPGDPFLLYGIAMEHKKAGRHEDAIEFFDRTILADSGYCYAFYQMGQTYELMGNVDRSRAAYEAGIQAARVKGDDHARSELEAAMSML